MTVSSYALKQQTNRSWVCLTIRRVDGGNFTPADIGDKVQIKKNVANDLATKGFVNTQIANINNTLNNEYIKKTPGKNLFNKNSPDVVTGYYVEYSTGIRTTNASYDYIVIPCEPLTNYVVNRNYLHIAWFNGEPNVTTGANRIGGMTTSAGNHTFQTGANATYLTLSYPDAAKDALQLELGTVSTEYAPYQFGLDGDEILDNSIDVSKLAFPIETTVVNTIVVDANGSGDYTTLRAAVESIQNPSQTNQYEIKILPGTYDISSEYTAQEWAVEDSSFVGLMIPDYTTLIGVGNKEEVIITASDTTQRTYVSTLNLRNTSGLKNLTVRASNLRYTIHDDYATAGQEKYVRTVENCDFYGENLKLIYVYGCGIKEGAEFHIKNCSFNTDVQSNFSFLMHNNTNWSRNAFVEIENCRFNPYATSYGCLFASMTNGAKLTYVTLKGNKMKKLRLNENSPSLYGAGIVFKVSGYANVIDSADIVNTDGQDYSSYIDLI